jgi:hypothetical protein
LFAVLALEQRSERVRRAPQEQKKRLITTKLDRPSPRAFGVREMGVFEGAGVEHTRTHV